MKTLRQLLRSAGLRLCGGYLPLTLKRACVRDAHYALELSTGEVIQFAGCKAHGDWLWLWLVDDSQYRWPKDREVDRLPFPCSHGVEVALKEVVWCAEIPEGDE